MKVLVLLAKGFETMEFSVFIDVFGWARNDFNHDIWVETCAFTPTVISSFKVPVCADKLIEEIDTNQYCALAIPGGFEEFGFYEDAYRQPFLDIIRDFEQQGKPIASICVAALALGKSGVLADRKATTYHFNNGLRQKQLAEFTSQVINEPIVIDRNVITSYCPQTAPEVAFILLEKLTSSEDAQEVKKAMGW